MHVSISRLRISVIAASSPKVHFVAMTSTDPITARPGYGAIAARMLLRVGFIAVIALGAHFAIEWAMALTDSLPAAEGDVARCAILLGATLLYALVLALPFVPGVEIGIALLMMRGAEMAPAVYLATVLGLSLAFVVGRALPFAALQRLFADLHLKQAASLIETIAPLTPEERIARLRARLPARLGQWVITARYLALAILLNLPLNAFLGGGGGLSVLAGISGLFQTPRTIAVIAISVLPVPLLVWFLGTDVLPGFM